MEQMRMSQKRWWLVSPLLESLEIKQFSLFFVLCSAIQESKAQTVPVRAAVQRLETDCIDAEK
jgi:hypothetical protein